MFDLDRMKAPMSPQAARLSEQNQRLKDELAKGRAQLEMLQSERHVLGERDAETDRLASLPPQSALAGSLPEPKTFHLQGWQRS